MPTKKSSTKKSTTQKKRARKAAPSKVIAPVRDEDQTENLPTSLGEQLGSDSKPSPFDSVNADIEGTDEQLNTAAKMPTIDNEVETQIADPLVGDLHENVVDNNPDPEPLVQDEGVSSVAEFLPQDDPVYVDTIVHKIAPLRYRRRMGQLTDGERLQVREDAKEILTALRELD